MSISKVKFCFAQSRLPEPLLFKNRWIHDHLLRHKPNLKRHNVINSNIIMQTTGAMMGEGNVRIEFIKDSHNPSILHITYPHCGKLWMSLHRHRWQHSSAFISTSFIIRVLKRRGFWVYVGCGRCLLRGRGRVEWHHQ